MSKEGPIILLVLVWTLLAPFPAAALKIAAVQMPVSTHIEKNLEKISSYVRKAAEAGADIILFPETSLSGFDRKTIENLDGRALSEAKEDNHLRDRKPELYQAMTDVR